MRPKHYRNGMLDTTFQRFAGVLIYGSGGDRALNGVLGAMFAGHLRETTAHCTPIGRAEPSGRCTPGMHRPRRETGGPAALPGNRPGEPQRRRGRADHSGNVTDMLPSGRGDPTPHRLPCPQYAPAGNATTRGKGSRTGQETTIRGRAIQRDTGKGNAAEGPLKRF